MTSSIRFLLVAETRRKTGSDAGKVLPTSTSSLVPLIEMRAPVGAKAGGGGSGGIGQMMFVFYAYSIELNRIVVCMIAVGIVALALDRMLRAGLRFSMPWTVL